MRTPIAVGHDADDSDWWSIQSRQGMQHRDSELVGQMGYGDVQAFGVLFDKWSDHVFVFAVRLLRDERAAERIVEAVFWQAWLQANSYPKFPGSPVGWLLSLARQRPLNSLGAIAIQPTAVRSVSNRPEDGTVP